MTDRHRAVRPTELALVARAVAGSHEDLLAAAARDVEEKGALAGRHRVPAQLLAAARDHGLYLRRDLGPAVDSWRRQMRGAAAGHLLLDAVRQRAAEALDSVDVDWLPLKGVDLVTRGVFEPAERPTGDIDLLVARADLEPARSALVAAGFVGLAEGPYQERYLREEGYAWQARGPGNALLELHWRLWGSAPADLPDRVLAASEPAPDLGPTARRPSLVHAWLLAAVHLWLDPPPRAAGRFVDLRAIAASVDSTADSTVDSADDMGEALRTEARALGLELPACLAAGVAATLWPDDASTPLHRSLRDALRPSLRLPERRLVPRRRAGWLRVAELPTSTVALARLVSRRPSRHGTRALWRRVWPHPGLVEASTDASAPWPLRRVRFQWRHLFG